MQRGREAIRGTWIKLKKKKKKKKKAKPLPQVSTVESGKQVQVITFNCHFSIYECQSLWVSMNNSSAFGMDTHKWHTNVTNVWEGEMSVRKVWTFTFGLSSYQRWPFEHIKTVWSLSHAMTWILCEIQVMAWQTEPDTLSWKILS